MARSCPASAGSLPVEDAGAGPWPGGGVGAAAAGRPGGGTEPDPDAQATKAAVAPKVAPMPTATSQRALISRTVKHERGASSTASYATDSP
jgi:hypothetical protein